MPPRRTRPSRSIAQRALYARTNADLLVNDPDGFPSSQPPISWLTEPPDGGGSWWYGSDAGGGATPIGPNGPWATGMSGGLAVVIRATELIIGPISAAPFRVLASGQTGTPSEPPPWIADPMRLRGDGRSTAAAVTPAVLRLPRATFWAEWVRSALWYGIGAFIHELDSAGLPLAGSLRLLDPRVLTTVRDDNGTLCWSIGTGPDAAVFTEDGYLALGPIVYRLTTLRNPLSPVDIEGRSMGVFEMNPSVFKLAGQVDSFSSGSFRSGVPAGYLKVETPGLSAEQAAMLKARWLASHGGDRRSIAVLNATTSFTPLQFSPVDTALAEIKRLNIGDVAFAFNIDPLMFTVTLGNSATYATTQAAFSQHKSYSLSPWLAAVQDTLSALMPGTQGVAVNLDQFENPPAGERFTAYQTAITAGVLTVDECRFLEGLPPLPASQGSDRMLTQQEAVQKVYLGVINGVITVPEARQMINDAGGTLDVNAIPEPVPASPPPDNVPVPAPPDEQRGLVRRVAWR